MNNTLPPSLDDLAAFAAVADARSFRQAAAALGVTPSALSHRLRALEARLGLRLLHRTTRSVAPTEAGQQLLATLAPALAHVRDAVAAVREQAATPAGTLRLTLPHVAARTALAPVLARLQAAHPRIAVELVCSDTLVDIVQDGFDAGVRFGERLQADMVAVAIGAPQAFAVVGTPAYLAAHGAPAAPADLAQHRCIQLRFGSGALYRWQFTRAGAGRSRVGPGLRVRSAGAAGLANRSPACRAQRLDAAARALLPVLPQRTHEVGRVIGAGGRGAGDGRAARRRMICY